jgi:microcompartment protein CcmL/EutN
MTEEIKREIRYLFYLHVVPRLHFDVAKAFKKMNEESERFSKIVEAV